MKESNRLLIYCLEKGDTEGAEFWRYSYDVTKVLGPGGMSDEEKDVEKDSKEDATVTVTPVI